MVINCNWGGHLSFTACDATFTWQTALNGRLAQVLMGPIKALLLTREYRIKMRIPFLRKTKLLFISTGLKFDTKLLDWFLTGLKQRYFLTLSSLDWSSLKVMRIVLTCEVKRAEVPRHVKPQEEIMFILHNNHCRSCQLK